MKLRQLAWWGVLGAVVGVASLLNQTSASLMETHHNLPDSPPSTLPNSLRFIELCTGVRLETETAKSRPSDVNMIAISNCLGRTRGYVDGHQMTMELNKAIGIQGGRRMWCVTQDVEDKDVLEAVMAWSDANPKEFAELTKQYNGLTASTAITMRAVSQKYPCAKI